MEINTLFSNKFMREEIKGEIKKKYFGSNENENTDEGRS